MLTAKLRSDDRSVTSVKRYWPVLLSAAVLAESAHAPLIGQAAAKMPDNSAVFKQTEDFSHTSQPHGVRDGGDYKPLAFADTHHPDRPEEEQPKSHWLPGTPLVLDPPPIIPDSPLAPGTGFVPPPADTLTIDGPGGGIGFTPVITEPQIFPAVDPAPGNDVTPPQTTVTGTVTVGTNPVTVPEPSCAVFLITGVTLARRRARFGT